MKTREQEIDDIRKTYYVDIAWLIDHGFKECTEEQYVSPISWRKGYEPDEDGQEEGGITLCVDMHGRWVCFVEQYIVIWDGIEPGVGTTPYEAIQDAFHNVSAWLGAVQQELFKHVADVVYTDEAEVRQ